GETEPGYIQLRVVDDGIHLSPEQLQWVWLPYVQGEKDFTGELPGMGLGFPMVATLVWQAGGDLRLRNRPDTPGVIVDMTIPLEGTSRQLQRSAARFGEG
ncbi:MAG: ATP-binding protein, partial [Anaerolineales bacterium]